MFSKEASSCFIKLQENKQFDYVNHTIAQYESFLKYVNFGKIFPNNIGTRQM